VESDAFAVIAAEPNAVRYVQQPTDVVAGVAIEPAVSVEIIDAFGNRTSSDATVSLTLLEAPCGGALSGGQRAAVDGLATFGDLRFNVPCVGNVLKAAAPGLGWDQSTPFTVTGTVNPISLNLASVTPGRTIRLVGTSPVALPTENPTVLGGSLTVSGAAASVTHQLPAEGWIGLGPNKDGSKGFKFVGGVCQVKLKPKLVRVVCNKTGDLALPEPGPLRALLRIGIGTRYCAECGGKARGNPAKSFKRNACPAPATCP
jgi:hypothetical protein